MKGTLFILSGPSGVGKDTLIRKLKEEKFPLYFAVTATTREKRPGEKDGVDYFFIKPEQFKKMLGRDKFLEWINIYNDIYYGTPKKPVLEALAKGQNVLLRIETQGADAIKQKIPAAIRIFLAPSHFEDLEDRLRTRHSESEDLLKIRLEKAHREMEKIPEYDFIVYNHDGELDKAVEEIKKILNGKARRKSA